MDLITSLTLGVATGIAKGIWKVWSGDDKDSNAIGQIVIGVLSGGSKDILNERISTRKFQEISDKIAISLLPIFKSVGNEVTEERKVVISELANQAIANSSISAELLLSKNLVPKEIEALFIQNAYYPNQENPRTNFTEQEERLFKRVISSSAEYIVDIATELPSFNEKTFAKLLDNDDSIIHTVDKILEEVKKMRVGMEDSNSINQEFEEDYRKEVIRKLDELQLFGVDISDASKKYRLETAYVRLSVEYNKHSKDSESEIMTIDELIGKGNCILLRGNAGSGKTTLMKWIAVQTAGFRLDKELLSAWNESVPFYIKLREFADKTLPTPNEFPKLLSNIIAEDMPKRWVTQLLKKGLVTILVDGIDEISEDKREDIKNWIGDIQSRYPNNKWVVTSRPYAANKGWLTDLSFIDADLQSMNIRDIENFVDHWHDSVKEKEDEPEKKQELTELSEKLKSKLKELKNLRKLATNPLLCAMICALHRERLSEIPSDRVKLYEACIDMFFRRDTERKVDLKDYPVLGDRQKSALLSDLAYYLIKNNWSEIDVDKADKKLQKSLNSLNKIPENVDGALVRKFFVERSGILREPTVGKIDFPHRTFEEFFAAKAIRYEEDFGLLLEKATNDQWREVIQLVCGITTPKHAYDIVKKLIRIGDENAEERVSLHLLAVSCLDVIVEANHEVKELVEERLSELVPPQNMEEAKNLAKAGDLVVPYLRSKKKRNAKESAASIRTLAIISSDLSLEAIKGYIKDNRKAVKDSLFDGIKYCDEPEKYARLRTYDLRQIEITQSIPIEILYSLPQLRKVIINNKGVTSIEPIKELENLEELYVKSSSITSLSPIEGKNTLKNLTVLDANVQERTDYLSSLTNITYLSLIGFRFKSNDFSWLNKLTKLQQVCLAVSKVEDISFVKHLPYLKSLDIGFTSVTDLSPIEDLLNLERIDCSNCKIDSLLPVFRNKKIKSLTSLGVGTNKLNDLSSTSNISSLCLTNKHIHYDEEMTEDLFNRFIFQGIGRKNRFNEYIVEVLTSDIGTSLPINLDSILMLNNIESLCIDSINDNGIVAVSDLVSLKSLKIRGAFTNPLKTLGKLSRLEHLELISNKRISLKGCEWFEKLKSLTIVGAIIDDLKCIKELSNKVNVYFHKCVFSNTDKWYMEEQIEKGKIIYPGRISFCRNK
jgi:Leucine-rich repeat (LRR) protein